MIEDLNELAEVCAFFTRAELRRTHMGYQRRSYGYRDYTKHMTVIVNEHLRRFEQPSDFLWKQLCTTRVNESFVVFRARCQAIPYVAELEKEIVICWWLNEDEIYMPKDAFYDRYVFLHEEIDRRVMSNYALPEIAREAINWLQEGF